MRQHPLILVSAVLLCGVALLALMGMVRPILLLPTAYPILYSEGWNAAHAMRLVLGLPLYPAAGELVTNNYPPLFYVLMSLWGKTGLDLLVTGRMIGLASFMAAILLVYALARRLGCRQTAAFFGGLALTATMARFFPYYIGIHEPQWPAHAVMLAGLYVLIRFPGRLATVIAVALMLTAGMIKHNVIAIPLASFTWMLFYRRQNFIVAVLSAGAIGALALVTLNHVYGPDLWRNILAPRVLSLSHFLHKQEHLAASAVAFVAWVVASIRWPKMFSGERAVLLHLLIFFGLLEFMLCISGEGVAANASFDLVLALSLGVAFMAERILVQKHPDKRAQLLGLFSFLFFLQIAAWPNMKYLAPAYDIGARAQLMQRAKAAGDAAAALAKVPGNAWCVQPALCVVAGKPFLFDAFNVDQRLSTHTLTFEELRGDFNSQNVRALQPEGTPHLNDKKSWDKNMLAPFFARMRREVTPDKSPYPIFAR